jgi:hypothetical protein
MHINPEDRQLPIVPLGASRLFLTLLLVMLAAATAGFADGPETLTREYKTELILDISRALDETYVFPEVAEKMIALLEQKLEDGGYDAMSTMTEFTQQLTADLQSISHDLHLSVRPFTRPPGEEGVPDRAAQRRRRLEQARRDNFGFRKVEMLPGNVGYLRLDGFNDADIAGDTAVAAMNFLANSAALIIDLRNNGGGSPSMIQLISSYFFEERRHLNTFYVRRSDSYDEFWTQESVKGPKMVDVPIYVLTSGRTFSAAEEFTYNLKHMERATIIGETTGGGAHPVDSIISDMGGGFLARASIPFGRAINPTTGTNWEGTGVKPHIEVTAEGALDRAQIEALAGLAEIADDRSERFALDWAREGLEATAHQIDLEASQAGAFVGQYGPRRITLEDGRLIYQREEGPRYVLLPMGNDRFRIDNLGFFRVQFVRDEAGKVIELTGLYEDGHTDGNSRSDG